MSPNGLVVSPAEQAAFEADGYLVRRGQLTADEVAALLDHYAALHAAGSRPGCFVIGDDGDPLSRWPRMMMPHRFDPLSKQYLLDPRLLGVVSQLYRREALAAQTMFYWKPPGARGQALHQDDFYLRTQPGECLAAWLALDPSDDQNGGLRVVPGSHRGELQCPHEANAELSFSAHEVDLQEGWEPQPVNLDAGDILFFGGRLIHGSPPNDSAERWRRTLICHYVPAECAACAAGYQPLLNAAGEELRTGQPGPESDPCGGPVMAAPGR